ncbi:MAG: alpha/beta hydrolase [Gemmatimonadales bacterium]|nr:alpha/beta hydrolase [Gemmatimonadales bacterium]
MTGILRIAALLVLCYVVFLVLLRLGESRMLYVPGGSRTLLDPPSELDLGVQRVELTASDGVRLVSWAMPADGGSGYWLLICHGNAGNISEVGRPRHYAGLRALGLSLFAFDYRGYGESEGLPTEAGLYRDADAAYRYLRDRLAVPPERIVVFGHSLGSAVAVELVSRVPAAGLVLDGALTSVVERAQEMFPYAPIRWIAASKYPSIERVGALTLPKLFLHARADEVIPFGYGRRLFEAAAPPKLFVELQGGHGDAFEVDSAAYFGAIGRFVAELDARQGS